MSETERATMVRNVTKRPQTYKAKRLGRLLELRYAERCYLHITTIKAIDQPSKKDVARERWHLRHAKKGGVSRAEYLTQFTTSAALAEPWVTLGMSRATYYRKLVSAMRETTVRLGPSAPPLLSGDEQPSLTRSLTPGAKPWLALGISRSTYYRRRKRDAVGVVAAGGQPRQHAATNPTHPRALRLQVAPR
jgi:predicted DNA-binding transcriptional regulator AlpA